MTRANHLSGILDCAQAATAVLGVARDNEILTLGTGTVVDAEAGLIATAAHVVGETWRTHTDSGATPLAMIYASQSLVAGPAGTGTDRPSMQGHATGVVAHWNDPEWDLAILQVNRHRERRLTALEPVEGPLPAAEAPVALFGYPACYETTVLRGSIGWFAYEWDESFTSEVPAGTLVFRMATHEGESGGPIVDLESGRLLGVHTGCKERPIGKAGGGIPEARAAPASAVRELMARAGA